MELDLVELRRRLNSLLPGVGTLLLFGLWIVLHGRVGFNWELSLLLAGCALVAWIVSYRRYRHYADTPSCALIDSAPQGYVALEGIGRALPGEPLRSPLTYLPCLWYRIRIEELDGRRRWRVESDETSEDSFVLEDRKGVRCMLDPVGAQVEALHCDKHVENDRRTTQWLLIPGTRIHVLGDFRSRRPIEDLASNEAELRDRLADWKTSGEALARFDADRNGELDLAEWETVREAAREEVLQEREAAADMPAYHLLGAPADGRPLVISDQPPEKLRRRYQLQAWSFLAAFFLLLAESAWLAHRA